MLSISSCVSFANLCLQGICWFYPSVEFIGITFFTVAPYFNIYRYYSDVTFLMPDSGHFYLFSFIGYQKIFLLSILLISKNELLCQWFPLLIFCFVFPCFLLCPVLFHFFSILGDFIYFSFSSPKVETWVVEKFFFSITGFWNYKFQSTTLVMAHRFYYFIFSFSFSSKYFPFNLRVI